TYHYSLANNFGSLVREKFDDKYTLIETSFPKLDGMAAADKPSGFLRSQFVVNIVDPERLLLGYKGLYESTTFAHRVTPIADTNEGPVVTALAFGGRDASGSLAPEVIYRARGNEIRVRSAASSWGEPQTLGSDDIKSIAMDPKNWKVAYAVGGKRVWATVDG